MTTIKCNKDLYNGGLFFSKGKEYKVPRRIHNEATLMDAKTTNDLGEQHLIGSWWRHFTIIDKK